MSPAGRTSAGGGGRAGLRLVVAGFFNFLTLAVVLPVLPRFVEGPLHGGDVAVGLTVASFSAAAMVVRPLAGRIGDRNSRRGLTIAGAGLMLVGLAGHGFAFGIAAFVVLRVVHALGYACFYTGALSMMVDLAPAHRAGAAVSVFTIGRSVAFAVGPILGELVVGAWGYGALWVVATLAAAAALALAVSLPEARRDTPITVDGSPWLPRASIAPGVVIALVMFGYASLSAFAPLYVVSLGLHDAGGVFVVHAVTVVAFRGAAASVVDRLESRLTVKLAVTASAAGLATIGTWPHVAGLYLGVALFSVGVAFVVPALAVLLLQRAAPGEQTAALGTFTAFFDVGIAAGGLTLGVVAAAWGYATVYVVTGVVVALGFLMVPKSPPQSPSDPTAGTGNA